MSPEILFTLLTCGIFGVVAVGILLTGGVIVVVFVWLTRRTTRIFKDVNEALQIKTDEYFADIVPRLQAWHPEALADLPSHLEMVGRRVAWSIHYRGTIKSLGQLGENWLAYELRLEWGKGSLVLRTSARTWQLDIRGSSSAQVTVGGKPLGRLHRQKREVTLFGVDDEPVGQYHRAPPGLWGWRNARRAEYFIPAYGPVELHGRPVAEINHNLIPSKYAPYLDQPMSALLRNLIPELTSEEEDWLLALVGLEIYGRILRYLSERPS